MKALGIITEFTPYWRRLALRHWERVNAVGEGLTDAQIQAQTNYLFHVCKGLDPYGYSEGFHQFLPMVGGNSACHVFDLFELQDATEQGTNTHDENGVTFNGTDGYFDTGIGASNFNSSGGVLVYAPSTLPDDDTYDTLWGARDDGNSSRFWQIMDQDDGTSMRHTISVSQTTVSPTKGAIGGNREGDSRIAINNAVAEDTTSNAEVSSFGAYNVFVGGRNQNGSLAHPFAYNCAAIILLKNLTNAEAVSLASLLHAGQGIAGRAAA